MAADFTGVVRGQLKGIYDSREIIITPARVAIITLRCKRSSANACTIYIRKECDRFPLAIVQYSFSILAIVSPAIDGDLIRHA
ncbi:MAG: hypothetical protein J7647_14775 [Cyanobacteria bacterium SBLK]|nr:hypothetical protein [Cyanobacteria bacterium SBLK]